MNWSKLGAFALWSLAGVCRWALWAVVVLLALVNFIHYGEYIVPFLVGFVVLVLIGFGIAKAYEKFDNEWQTEAWRKEYDERCERLKYAVADKETTASEL